MSSTSLNEQILMRWNDQERPRELENITDLILPDKFSSSYTLVLKSVVNLIYLSLLANTLCHFHDFHIVLTYSWNGFSENKKDFWKNKRQKQRSWKNTPKGIDNPIIFLSCVRLVKYLYFQHKFCGVIPTLRSQKRLRIQLKMWS